MNPKKPRRICAAGCGRRCAEAQSFYCSIKCVHHKPREEKFTQFMRGEFPAMVQVTPMLRRFIIRNLGMEACMQCGWAKRHPITGRIPVEVEHRDGDWRNNKPQNLTLLCPNCHSLTSTYRGLNRGRGRSERLGGRSNPFRGSELRKEGRRAEPKKCASPAPESEKQLWLTLPM
jgi:hypothetical protein